MYKILKKSPSQEHIGMFNMQESSNEAFRNFKIDLNTLSGEQKKLLCDAYALQPTVLTYKDDLFLSVPL